MLGDMYRPARRLSRRGYEFGCNVHDYYARCERLRAASWMIWCEELSSS
jgi:hypothetical protein